MKKTTYIGAFQEALREEMSRDERIFLLGEDIGIYGGGFKETAGLFQEFGEKRVIDTPISENSFVGIGVGAALSGMRPVVFLMFADLLPLACEQIVNEAAKMRFVSAGKMSVPIVIVPIIMQGFSAGITHAQSLISWCIHIPGVKTVVPSTPYDVKGLMKTAVRDNDPVIFHLHAALFGVEGLIPEEEYFIPFGKADIKREGEDVTVVAISSMVSRAIKAAEELAKQGISVEVVDPRTLIPFDKETIKSSVQKTRRLVIAETDCKTGGVGAEIAAIVAEEAFDSLDAPIRRVACLDMPPPFSPVLEKHMIPDENRIIKAIKEVI
ncbi:alpha-ketoacid dehydrogenase subunit beta [Candidatus Bathyarchaeota archaeon]|nr:MAG: alpha-ketoacid dehydrogenase subunit beta [Candidatus Bathyarchaeota archaeon]